jgi:hypothetical protein
MIIKFRDATIKRYNQKDKLSSEEIAAEINQMQAEITHLKQ